MLRLSERNANIFADCNASDSNIDFVKGVPSGQAFTSEGVLLSKINKKKDKVGDFSSLRSIEMTKQRFVIDKFCSNRSNVA